MIFCNLSSTFIWKKVRLMFKKIVRFFSGKQYEVNKSRENYLCGLGLLCIAMLQRQSSEDQTRFLLDTFKEDYRKDISLEDLSYSLTDFIATLDQNITPSWLDFEFKKGLDLHPDTRLQLLENFVLFQSLGECNSILNEKLIELIALSMNVKFDFIRYLYSEVLFANIEHTGGSLGLPYVESHRILNDALSRTTLSISSFR